MCRVHQKKCYQLMAQLPWEEQTHSDVGRSILIWQSFTAWITMMLSNMLQRQQLIFFFTYWLSGLVIYSFFFFIYNGPRVISRYMERRSYMPMMEAPTQREQEKLRRPSSTYLDLQTDCSSNIYFLFIWLTACCIFTFPNDFM